MDEVRERVEGEGVEVDVRRPVRDVEPADDLIGVAEEVDAEHHRDRPAPASRRSAS